MDARGDQDIEVQRSSPDLIAALTTSLPRFLRKTTTAEPGACAATRVRTLVPSTKTDQLIRLLEPFQEWPQLLDPHLAGLLEPLVTAFVEYLPFHSHDYFLLAGKPVSRGVIPLPRAICRILYTFCKVRGQKVVGQFLNNEPQYLERMLEALERWVQSEGTREVAAAPDHGMIWEERYIMLLWLSHLMLAPFDLISMSSDNVGPIHGPARSLKIDFPRDTPAIGKRLVSIAEHYLDFASKEREVAALLLSRLALRSDMRQVGLQKCIIDSALKILGGCQAEATSLSIYVVIGILSFLARFISSAETERIQHLLASIYESMQNAKSDDSPLHKEIKSSSVARKLTIKIARELSIAGIKIDSKNPSVDPSVGEGSLEEVIDELLTALAAKDTLVRVAASKALSLIAVPLESEMASQIVELVLDKLAEDVVWPEAVSSKSLEASAFPSQGIISASGLSSSHLIVDLSHVNAMNWHGLILTLSQLIFYGSMPRYLIPKALESLDLALHFEQRSSLGISVGDAVRDAACFGLWSLARKYTTAELTAEVGSTLQIMANGLIVTATLDSAGNIRRGASAALQEMIGRHPGEIKHGIELVQVIDYHAIALRSRAMLVVAKDTSKIDNLYWDAILAGLLDWRGVGSADATSRRHAAQLIGLLAVTNSPNSTSYTISMIRSRLRKVPSYKVDERHGLLLALAEIVRAEVKVHNANLAQHSVGTESKTVVDQTVTFLQETSVLWTIYCTDRPHASPDIDISTSKLQYLETLLRSQLMCEAVCSLISALAWSTTLSKYVLGKWQEVLIAREETQTLCVRALELSLEKTEFYVLRASANLAKNLFGLLSQRVREALMSGWAERIRRTSSISTADSKTGATAALAAVFGQIGKGELPTTSDASVEYHSQEKDIRLMLPMRALIIDTLLYQIKHPGTSVELRCSTLRSLTSGVLDSKVITVSITEALISCLEDYTTDQRGDVGSLVRIAATDAVAAVLKRNLLSIPARRSLVAKICGLAVEKLDKVRWRAWTCLQSDWSAFGSGSQPSTTITDIAQTSTSVYFLQMISLSREEWARRPLLKGYVTSAGSGSESVLQASREAFVAYAAGCSQSVLATYCTDIVDIVENNLANDRLLVSAVEFLDYLFDAGVLPRLAEDKFCWSRLFNLIQRTHLKSQAVHKIGAAIKVYAGMTVVSKVKVLAFQKLCRLLQHPFPKVRNDAADALFVITQDEEMLRTNWSKPARELEKSIVKIKESLSID